MSGKAEKKIDLGTVVGKGGIYIILLLLVIISSFLSDKFLTSRNLLNVSRQISVVTILSLGEMLLMISGGIDLSVGSQAALCGFAGIASYMGTGSMALAIIAGMLAGCVLGVVNGTVAALLKVPAFIATLGTNMIFRGAVNVYTGGQVISEVNDFAKFGQGYVWKLPIPILVMIIVILVIGFVMRKTIYGRRLMAVGGNYDAARASGIKVRLVQFSAYVFSGALAGLAGVVLLSRLNSGIPTAAEGYELDAIAGAVIGGVSMTGGAGTAIGVFAGALIIGIINNILNLTGVMSYVQNIVKGAIIIGAVLLDMQTKRKRS